MAGRRITPRPPQALPPRVPLKVRWLKRALANLNAEAEYISRDSPAAARRVVGAIVDAAEFLARYPALGRPGRVAGTRELVIAGTPYIVPYRVREATVEILRVFHAARKQPPRRR